MRHSHNDFRPSTVAPWLGDYLLDDLREPSYFGITCGPGSYFDQKMGAGTDTDLGRSGTRLHGPHESIGRLAIPQ